MNKLGKRHLLHIYRIGIFVTLLVLIRQQHEWRLAQRRGAAKQLVSPAQVIVFFPVADRLGEWDAGHGGQSVYSKDGKRLGRVIQTTPQSDEIYGFSGPTNSMVAFDAKGQILGVKILQSDDTKEHLAQVRMDSRFLYQWNGQTARQAVGQHDIHTVSGATLSSLAIAEGISARLGGERRSRFPKVIELAEVRAFLPKATRLAPELGRPFLQSILDGEGKKLGYVARSSPHADHMTGYQGPTDVLIVLDAAERIAELTLRESMDNEPYVRLLTEDEYFFNGFKGFNLAQLAELELAESGLDVVSGATKTSVTVAEGLVFSAGEISQVHEPPAPRPWFTLRFRDAGTILVALSGIAIALTRLRGVAWLRWSFQAVLILYLGLINGDMLSQALLGGWAKSGIPWRVAPGLVFLSAAALIVPAVTGRQAYCTHLCPYGAAQNWLKNRVPWRIAVKGKWDLVLRALPVALLLGCLLVTMNHWPFSLVQIEPFDAFVFRIAGWAPLSIAVIGLAASLFMSKPYCRYGCPTGAMLKFLRYRGAAGQGWGLRDWIAAGFLLCAIVCMVLR